MTIGAICRALVPGLGQIHAGRAGKGLLLFFLFAFFLNGYAILPFLHDDPALRYGSLGLAILVWLASFADALRRPPAAVEAFARPPETTAHQVDVEPADPSTPLGASREPHA